MAVIDQKRTQDNENNDTGFQASMDNTMTVHSGRLHPSLLYLSF